MSKEQCMQMKTKDSMWKADDCTWSQVHVSHVYVLFNNCVCFITKKVKEILQIFGFFHWYVRISALCRRFDYLFFSFIPSCKCDVSLGFGLCWVLLLLNKYIDCTLHSFVCARRALRKDAEFCIRTIIE